MTRRTDDRSSRPSPSSDPAEHPLHRPPNAFTRELLAALRRRDHHPATPEAEFAGPWRVSRLYGGPPPDQEVRWACFTAGGASRPSPTGSRTWRFWAPRRWPWRSGLPASASSGAPTIACT